jgi:hypothetical protein
VPSISGVVRWLKFVNRSEGVTVRHDLHQLFACRDHATFRVDGLVEDEAGLRRADVDALALILSRRPFFGQLRHLGSNIGELRRDIGPGALVDLQDLQFGLRDLAPRLRQGRFELAGVSA